MVGIEVIKADIRVVAATNRNLEKMVEEGKFREDLLYRLKVIPIHVPSLRERKEDIGLLAEFFADKYSREMNNQDVIIENSAIEILKNYDFLGNIRELENIIERSVILSSEGKITAAILPKEIVKDSFSNKNDTFILPEEGISLEEVEESLVRQALKRVRGNQTHAAKLLGISRHALIYRIDKYKIM